MTNKKKTLTIMTVIVIAGSLFGVKSAYAATPSFWGGNFFSGFITFLAQKFGLDKTQVQSAMRDYKQQTRATITPRPTMSPQDREAGEKKRLDPLVSQGKITTDQENAIISEQETVRLKYKPDSNETPDQRKTQVIDIQSELKTWAEGEGIDPIYVVPEGRRMDGRRRGPKPTATP